MAKKIEASIKESIQEMFSPEKMREALEEGYKSGQQNPNNLSNWFPCLKEAVDMQSRFVLPHTEIVPMDIEMYEKIRVEFEKEADERQGEVNEYFWSQIGFSEKDKFFIKNGLFSNKFNFKTAVFDPETMQKKDLAYNVFDITYGACMLSVPSTSEFVFRSYVEDDIQLGTIYEGMPLRPEFRYFYDFESGEMMGVSEYWHPDLMTKSLRGNEKNIYEKAYPTLKEYFDKYRDDIGESLEFLLKNVEGLKGKWSVDVMMTKNELYIIDMALMNQSALVDKMIPLK